MPTIPSGYSQHTSAVALFFNYNGVPSIRFVAYDIGWEFSDNGVIGPDPKGILYYKNGYFHGRNSILPRNQRTTAGFYVDQINGSDDKKREVRIKFYAPGSSSEVIAEFIAYDPHNRAGNSGLFRQSNKTAQWHYSAYTTGPATAEKERDNTRVTLTYADKVAKMDSTRDGQIYGDGFQVDGRLSVKYDLSTAQKVSWYKDRCVFHNIFKPNDYVAFFFPHDEFDTIGSKDNMEWWVNWN